MEKPTPPPPRWLSVQDAARHVGVSIYSMYRAVKGRIVPSTKFGRRVLVDRTGLDRVMASGGVAFPGGESPAAPKD